MEQDTTQKVELIGVLDSVTVSEQTTTTQINALVSEKVVEQPVVKQSKPKLFLRTFLPSLLVVVLYIAIGFFSENKDKLGLVDYLKSRLKEIVTLLVSILIVYGFIQLFR